MKEVNNDGFETKFKLETRKNIRDRLYKCIKIFHSKVKGVKMLLKLFLKHEILYQMKSERIFFTVILFLTLFFSIFTFRVIDFQKQLNDYLSEVQFAEETIRKAENFSHINPMAIHRPLVFSIYNQGFQFNRVISIRFFETIERTESINEDVNLVFLGKSRIDITFFITFFLSLFILLISYDSVNGEKKSGTLRLQMTYPIKRQSIILKKILGGWLFVTITFTLPFIISLFILIIIYGALLTGSFFLCAFFYWFLVLLFTFFFCMLGILISVCTTSTDRSLVFCLLSWMLLCIVLPISWDHIISRNLYSDQLSQLRRIIVDNRIKANEVSQNFNFGDLMYMQNNGRKLNRVSIFSFESVYETHYRYQKYLYDNMTPAIFDTEYAVDNVQRKLINIENTKSRVFFFNPIVLFQNLCNLITGNSRADYLRFLQDGRSIRNSLLDTGATNGWLFDYRYLAIYSDPHLMWDEDDFWQKYKTMDMSDIVNQIDILVGNADAFKFELPIIKNYEQPNPTFYEIFIKIVEVLSLFVTNILALWIITWYKFMRFDVR